MVAVLIIRGSVKQQSIFSLRFYRISIGTDGKLKKQAHFARVVVRFMLLLDAVSWFESVFDQLSIRMGRI